MERVAFLLEQSGTTLACLLNPNSLVRRRVAGVRPRRAAGGSLLGTALADDPLLYTGGGRTELDLDLLFDVTLAGSSIQSDDVRDLTGPLWDLAENAAGEDGHVRPPRVRFVWGKSWNMPGVVVAVAERLEQFTPEGAPQRSWLRMRLLRVEDNTPPPGVGISTTGDAAPPMKKLADLEDAGIPEESVQVHEVIGAEGAGDERGSTSERLDEIAFRYYQRPDYWRLLAAFNGIEDPLHIPPGKLLRIPPSSPGTSA